MAAIISKLFWLTVLMNCGSRLVSSVANPEWFKEKFSHRSKPISLDALTKLALHNDPTRTNSFEALLDPILVTRVPGTLNHERVKQYLIEHMTRLGWTVETDAFEDSTPFGVKPFENIIATLNPDTPRRLVLACHYDSKYSKKNDFIGATDSAVPCAMLLDLAYNLQKPLEEHKNNLNNVTLQFIFFDGEEAFVNWSQDDSIYGARHLAQKWLDTPYRVAGQSNVNTNYLHRMDMLVLLDLIGTKNPKFYNYFENTSHWYNLLKTTEEALKNSRGRNLWAGPKTKFFQDRRGYGGIEDDHIPFYHRGVDILHIITSPFPSIWHTARDNRDALHFPTIDNFNKILRTFVAAYLHLNTS